MEPHLSDLSLDALALRGPAPEPHLSGCARCQARLASLLEARTALLGDPRYHALRSALIAEPPPQRSRLRWLVPLAAAASLLLVLGLAARPRPPTTRLKGGLGVEVASERGDARPAFAPGDTVSLRLSAAGHPYALVLAVAPDGGVSTLWPPHASTSGPAPQGAGAPLAPAFRVTPGDLRLWAFFSDAPISAERARESLAAGVEAARAAGTSSLSAEPPPVEGEAGRASADFHVEDAR